MSTIALDALLRQRARSVLHQSGLFQHLPLTGLMLEIGADSGHLVEAVMRRMSRRRCIAVDPSRPPLRRLRSRLSRRDLFAARAGGEALPFADARFDAAWTSFALHRLPPPAQERVLAEMARVVRPGGHLFLIEDTPQNGWHRAMARGEDRWLHASSPPAYHYRSAADWRAALCRHGWQVQEEIAFSAVFPQVVPWPAPRSSFVCLRG